MEVDLFQKGQGLIINHVGVIKIFIYPTDTKRVTSNFNRNRKHPITGKNSFHSGVDIAQSGHHEIKAVANGTVSRSYHSESYGECIMIVHKLKGKTWETVYAHMKSGSRKVKEGDTVKQGQAIGVMGSTGNVTGQHLHFELHEGRWNINKSNAVDPLKYLSDSVQVKEEKTLLYTVKGGDTLSQIAKDHNTTIAALVRINNIKDKNNHARTTLKAIGEEKRWHLHSQKR